MYYTHYNTLQHITRITGALQVVMHTLRKTFTHPDNSLVLLQILQNVATLGVGSSFKFGVDPYGESWLHHCFKTIMPLYNFSFSVVTYK